MESIKYTSGNQEAELPAAVEGGRSYDCVYCKRGFNTAQALGGHMNIHRKDRASRNPNKPNNNNKTTLNVPAMYYQHHHQVLTAGSYPPPPPESYHHQLSYRTYFPASTSDTPVFDDNSHQCLNLIGDDWRMMRLSLQLHHVHDDVDKNGRFRDADDDDVDLELRLGHDR